MKKKHFCTTIEIGNIFNEPAQNKTDFLFGLLEQQVNAAYIGEVISQLEHSVQAAQAAEKVTQDPAIILAALFHDIGHFVPGYQELECMEEYGVKDHDKIGADFLMKMGFPEKMCLLVASHVDAKRYLCYKKKNYWSRLSEASKKTLEFQGGKMTLQEAELFENDPLFEWYLKIRIWDEKAKESGISTERTTHYKKLCLELLEV